MSFTPSFPPTSEHRVGQRETDILQIMCSASTTRTIAESCYDHNHQNVIDAILYAIELVETPVRGSRLPPGTSTDRVVFSRRVLNNHSTWEQHVTRHYHSSAAADDTSILFGDAYGDEVATEDEVRAFDEAVREDRADRLASEFALVTTGDRVEPLSQFAHCDIKMRVTSIMTRLDSEMGLAAEGSVFSEGSYKSIADSLREIYELCN